jgi:serine/threonine protein kinase
MFEEDMKFFSIGNNIGNRYLFIKHSGAEVGGGSSSTIYLGLSESDGMEVAVKVLGDIKQENVGVPHNDESLQKFFDTEVKILKEKTGMAGVVSYRGYEIFEDRKNNERSGIDETIISRSIAISLMECSLHEVVRDRWQPYLGSFHHLSAVRYVIASVIHTLKQLSRINTDVNLIHRDIKPQNILFDHLYQVKLIDFGISRKLKNAKESTFTSNVSATFKYVPPEAFTQSSVHFTSDIFSIGLVLVYTLVGNDNCWGQLGRDTAELLDKFYDYLPIKFSPHIKYAAKHLVSTLIEHDTDKRAFRSSSEGHRKLTPKRIDLMYDNILRHPFFWDDSKCINWLISVGNLIMNISGAYGFIQDRLEKSYKWKFGKTPTDNWTKIITSDPDTKILWHLHQKEENPSLNQIEVLRFIRNCFIHSGVNEEDDKLRVQKIREDPIFLRLFPELVVDTWEVIYLISEHYGEQLLISEILKPLFHPDPFALESTFELGNSSHLF